jgi:transcriptional regulator with XRE-family HTH domain
MTTKTAAKAGLKAKAASKAAPPRASRDSAATKRAPSKARGETTQRGNGGAGTEGLQIGARVKHARQLAGIRMRELAHKVGCTESMVSKIESGRVVPSLQMLQRLVAALDRDIASFFGSDLTSPGLILRAGQRQLVTTDPLRKGSGVAYERLVPFAAGNLLECNIHVVELDAHKQDPITHQGETVGYVIEGQIELTIDTTAYALSTGDSFFFKNHLTNSYRNIGPGRARVLWVNTPQVH